MAANERLKPTPIIFFCVLSIAVIGYFMGLRSPMRGTQTVPKPLDAVFSNNASPQNSDSESSVIPATNYADIATASRLRAQQRKSRFALKSSVDPLAEVKIQPGDKLAALQQRDKNRAFNGAPPTIPHPIDQKSAQACMACHGAGAKTISLRIPRMSHHFLENCTQCHVESKPKHMPATVFRENTFAGLAAPTAGPRAFAQAPPQIPHATWMRTDCMSCHGLTGLHGIRTTHPWRKNCQQCHAPSATMDQTMLTAEPKFLPGPKIEN